MTREGEMVLCSLEQSSSTTNLREVAKMRLSSGRNLVVVVQLLLWSSGLSEKFLWTPRSVLRQWTTTLGNACAWRSASSDTHAYPSGESLGSVTSKMWWCNCPYVVGTSFLQTSSSKRCPR